MKMLKDLYEKFTVKAGNILHDKKGQTMIEYALVIVLVAIALVILFRGQGSSGLSVAGSRISSAFNQ